MAFEFTDSNFAEAGLQGVVLVGFWAEWSGPCRTIAQIIEKLAADYEGRALVGKLDIDDNPEVGIKYGIRSVPVILILGNGQVIYKHIGLTTKQVLADELDAALFRM